MLDSALVASPDDKFVAHAVATWQVNSQAEELPVEFDPVTTEAEASTAAHMATVA